MAHLPEEAAMTEPASALHAWLDAVDTVNGAAWYEHVVARNFVCGCKPWSTYCPEWAPKPPAKSVKSFWVRWNTDAPTDDAVLEREAKRRSYIMLQAWHGDLAARLKRFNPNLIVLAYKDSSSTRSYDTNNDWGLLPAGVSYQYAGANRPEWFLLDTSGRRMQYDGYPGHWQMDIGNPEYQRMWADNVLAGLKGRFDGVLVDNLLWVRDAYHPGIYPRAYADTAAFHTAYKSFLGHVTPRLRAAGLMSFGNLSGARLHAGGWNTYMQYLDGGWDEWWLAFSDTNLLSEYEQGWRRQVAQVLNNEQAGKHTLVQPQFTPGAVRPFRYALASYLLVAGSRSAIAEMGRMDGYGHPTPWHPEYDWDLGTPAGPYTWVATNVFKRAFSKGMAVVNANRTDSPAVTVQLGGSYLDESGRTVTSVSLPGTTGAILRKP